MGGRGHILRNKKIFLAVSALNTEGCTNSCKFFLKLLNDILSHFFFFKLLSKGLAQLLNDGFTILVDSLEAGHVAVLMQNTLGFGIIPVIEIAMLYYSS